MTGSSKKLKEKLKIINVIRCLTKCSMINHAILAFCLTAFGFVLNQFGKMDLFFIKGPIGFLLYIFLICSLKIFVTQNEEIDKALSGDPELTIAKRKYLKRVYSDWNYIVTAIAIIYFVSISLKLKFVFVNLIGIYSLIGLGVVVFFGFIIYQEYIYLMILLRDLSKIKDNNATPYYDPLPERTEWLTIIAAFSQKIRYLAIAIGTLFTVLFVIFSPINSIDILFNQGSSSALFWPLATTWLIIFFLIVLMIPLSGIIRSYYLNQIYNRLKEKAINTYKSVFSAVPDSDKAFYLDILWRIHESKFHFDNSFSWLLPSIASVLNFSVVIVSLLSQLKELGITPFN